MNVHERSSDLKVIRRTRGPAPAVGVAVDTQETGIGRRRFHAQRQQDIPLNSPIDQLPRTTAPVRQIADDTSSRSISGLRLKSTRWNRVLYRVGCLAVEDD